MVRETDVNEALLGNQVTQMWKTMTPVQTKDLIFRHLSCRWTIAILFVFLNGLQRPSKILKAIPGLSKKVFYERVAFLIDEGFIEKTVVRVFPSHVEYRFTEKGKKSVPLLMELQEFDIGEEPLSHVFKCKWLKSILNALSKNTLRTMEIKDAIGKVRNKVLSEKLKKLEMFQLVEKRLELSVPVMVKYNLSPLGKLLAGFLQKCCVVEYRSKYSDPMKMA